VEGLKDVDIDLRIDDVLHNLVTKESQLMEDCIPWRGSWEKDPIFLQMLIQATILVSDLMVDYIASTGRL
jgi:hypothetical protein